MLTIGVRSRVLPPAGASAGMPGRGWPSAGPGCGGGIAALVSLPSVLAAQALAAISGWLFRALGG